MYEFGYTFEDVERMTMDQFNFLATGIKWYKEEEAEAIRRANRRR
jgi:hypothetical protein